VDARGHYKNNAINGSYFVSAKPVFLVLVAPPLLLGQFY
jgi:hypothetical protein